MGCSGRKEGIGEQGNYTGFFGSSKHSTHHIGYHTKAQDAHLHVSFWSHLGIFFLLPFSQNQLPYQVHTYGAATLRLEKAAIPEPHHT